MKVKRQTRCDARKLIRICVAKGEIDFPRARQVASGIAESDHRGRVELLWEFRRLVRLECERRSAEIASATPIQQELRERISANLEHLYGRGLQIHFVERPELIGGLCVLVGSDLYDDSVRHRLTLLGRSFSAADGW